MKDLKPLFYVATLMVSAAGPAHAAFFNDVKHTFTTDIPHFFQDDIPCAFGGQPTSHTRTTCKGARAQDRAQQPLGDERAASVDKAGDPKTAAAPSNNYRY